MRVLITGGAGFIGSHFVDHVLKAFPDAHVTVLDALTYAGSVDHFDVSLRDGERFTFWHGNVTNGELVQHLVDEADAVVHFAAESHVARSIYDNSLFYLTDVLGTQAVANAVAKSGRVERFVHISTSEVYGTAVTEPMDEDHPLNPMSPYASAKAGADRLVYSYAITYGIPALIVRPFNNFGPRQHLEKVVPRFVCGALDGDPLTVHGSGEAMRDWLYVDDTCRALVEVLRRPLPTGYGACPVFNIGSGRPIAVRAIAEMVCDLTGRSHDLIAQAGDRPGQVAKHVADSSRFEREYDWRPRVSFEDGLERTVAWYRANEVWWRRQEWMKRVPVRTANGHVEYH